MKIWTIAGIALIVVIAGTLMTGSLVFARSSNQAPVEQAFADQERGERESRGPGRGGNQGAQGPNLEDLAAALGLTTEELQAEFEAGKRLPELLEELGIDEADLQAALQAARVAHIQQAVSDGELTQEQADEMLERMETAAQVAEARQALRAAQLEQAVSDGTLTQEQADLLAEFDGKGSPGMGGGGIGGGGGRGGRSGPGAGMRQGDCTPLGGD
jgi:tape measure domain-containing protein